jgi:hypothetical protein
MNDEELRLLIREAIQRHMRQPAAMGQPGTIRLKADTTLIPESPLPVAISFGQYRLERAAGDTTCLIEPAVQCNHCGFCKCHGH